jgi:hypothetical protein
MTPLCSHAVQCRIERLTAELAGERAARQADQERHQEQLAVERAARQADQEHMATRMPQEVELMSYFGWRKARSHASLTAPAAA